MSDLRVLYVDDDRDLRDVGAMSLELDAAITVRAADSGASALAIIDSAEWRPDVVIMDVMMPRMDGPALLAALRARRGHQHTPVIFITARTQPDEMSAYMALGITGLITKPFDPLNLASQVRAILGEQTQPSPASIGALPRRGF